MDSEAAVLDLPEGCQRMNIGFKCAEQAQPNSGENRARHGNQSPTKTTCSFLLPVYLNQQRSESRFEKGTIQKDSQNPRA